MSSLLAFTNLWMGTGPPCAGEKCANLFGRFLNDSDVPRVHTKTLGVNMQWVLIFFGARPRSENTTCVIW